MKILKYIKDNNIEEVKKLIDSIDLNNEYYLDITPLILASSYNHKEKVKLLINSKVDLNKRNIHGETALIIASYGNHKEIVKLLINSKVDLNIQDNVGMTALMWASEANHKEIVELLIISGADLNIKNKIGIKAIDFNEDKKIFDLNRIKLKKRKQNLHKILKYV